MRGRHAGLFLSLCGVAAIAACAARALPRVMPPDVDRAQLTWPGTTAADLDHGRSLYLARCSSCHQPVLPDEVPAIEWPGHVDEMKERSALNDQEAALVTRYLVTMSERTASK